jgi:hypothetical protein
LLLSDCGSQSHVPSLRFAKRAQIFAGSPLQIPAEGGGKLKNTCETPVKLGKASENNRAEQGNSRPTQAKAPRATPKAGAATPLSDRREELPDAQQKTRHGGRGLRCSSEGYAFSHESRIVSTKFSNLDFFQPDFSWRILLPGEAESACLLSDEKLRYVDMIRSETSC